MSHTGVRSTRSPRAVLRSNGCPSEEAPLAEHLTKRCGRALRIADVGATLAQNAVDDIAYPI